MSNVIVVHNSQSGSQDLAKIKKAFASHNLEPTYLKIESKGLSQTLQTAKPLTVVAAGGDGTVNAVAHLVQGTPHRLGVVPAGTLNHFAKDLNLPIDIAKAVGVITKGSTRRVDVGTVNGRVFVNNSSIGVYPRSLRTRSRYDQQVGKWPAAVMGFAHALLHPRRYHVELSLKGKQTEARTPFVFIGNNPYHRAPNLGKRATLEGGQLAVYVIKAGGVVATLRMLLHGLFTAKHRTRDFAVYITPSCTIRTRRHRRLLVAYDGEVKAMRTPLHYRSEHQALRVIVP